MESIVSMTRRQFLARGMQALALLGVSKGYYNTTSYQLELKRVKIEVPNLPSPFKGLRIGLLSDFHSSFFVSKDHIATAATMIMKENPDIIVLAGDFTSGIAKPSGSPDLKKESESSIVTYLQYCIDALSGLKAPMGIYGVLGNHDFWNGQEGLNLLCSSMTKRPGVVWLRNSHTTLKKQGSFLSLLGVDDYWEKSCSLQDAYKGVDEDSVKILCSHNPDINIDIDIMKKKIDLVLAGHTHGGQVVLPVIGAPFLPSVLGQKYRIGLVADGTRQTFVTTGVGHFLVPVRYNCPAEVALLVLS